MLDLHDFENRPYLTALHKQRRKAKAALTLEKVILHSWRLFYWLLFFAGLWLLQIPNALGIYFQCSISIIFFIGIIYLFKKDILTFKLPTLRDVDHAIEKESKVTQGFIGLLYDTLANPKAANTRSLWDSAQIKILHGFKKLKAPSITAHLHRKDPSALRYIAILFFISGLLFAGANWQQRIVSGMFPYSIDWQFAHLNSTTNLWITAPEYTQVGQYHIIGSPNKDPLNIPEDSTIRIRMHTKYGGWFPPILQNGNEHIKLEPLGEDLYGIETSIAEGTQINIKQLIFNRDSWHYTYIKDQPPQIWLPKNAIEEIDTNAALSSEKSIDKKNEDTSDKTQNPIPDAPTEKAETITPPPVNESEQEQVKTKEQKTAQTQKPPYEIMDNLSLRFSMTVKDDYSVKELSMHMDIDPLVEDLPLGDPLSETRLVMSAPNEEFLISPTYDLTWHTWAGLPVQVSFIATDHKNQSTELEPISLILPEREFEHPMAKSLISMRKRLAWDYRDNFFEISRNLETLLSAPDFFQNDPVIFLAIRSASSRLFHNFRANEDKKVTIAKEVIALLWEAAIVVEDGNLSLAMRNLRNVQRKLENAMRDPNSTEEEISKLMDEMREKMAEYFKEMQREMQKRIENGEMPPPMAMENFDQLISPDILSEMMAEIEEALRNGDQEKAQDLMSKMQRMMEMMDPSMQAQMPQDMQMMSQGINELQQLIEKQEDLLLQTRTYSEMLDQLKGQKEKKEQEARIQKQEQEKKQENPAPSDPDQGQEIEDMLKDFGFEITPPQPAPYTPPERKHSKSEQKTIEDIPENIEETVSTSKTEQESLRFILGQLMLEASEKLSEVPEKMGLAEQEMRGSSAFLELSDAHQAIPHQEQAIEYLKEAQEDLQQQLQQRMQQMIGITMSGKRPYSSDDENRDPLGRPYGGDQSSDGDPNSSKVQVPDEAEKKRVDEILKTLRDRSGERYRPDDELDYFQRLLRQFR